MKTESGHRSLKLLVIAAAVVLTVAFSYVSARAENQVIKVGYYAFDGYQMEDAKGSRSGYGYDFLQEMARYTDWTYDYVGYDIGWAKLQEQLTDGTIDILTSARKTPERESEYLFSEEDIGKSSGILTVKSGDTSYSAGDYTNYNGMKIGMIKDSSINAAFEKFAAEKGFSYEEVNYANADDLNAALRSGAEINAAVTTNLRRTDNEWILDTFDTAGFFVMMNKDSTGLKKEVDAAIALMDKDNPNWRTELWDKYYQNDSGDYISLSGNEKFYLKSLPADRVFTVLVDPDREPYSYFEDGEAAGVFPEIVNEIAKRAGISISYLRPKTTEEYDQMLKAGDYDIVADAFFNYDQAEKYGFKMTDPYMETTLTRIFQKNLSSEPKTVAVVSGDYLSEADSGIQSGVSSVLRYATIRDCIDAVSMGKADACYVYPYTAQKVTEEDDEGRLSAALLSQYTVSFAVGINNKDSHYLVSILNKAVNSVTQGYVAGVLTQQTKINTGTIPLKRFLYQNIWAAVALLFVLMAAAGFILYLIMRQKNMKLLEMKNRQLSEAVLEANKASEAKSVFLSGISHDMRTPLNGIIGFTEFALKTDDPVKKQEYLLKVRQSGNLLLGLIGDTLEMSRISSGKFALSPKPCRTQELMDGILTVTQAAADAKGIHFISKIEGLPEYVMADGLKLQEVFINLLTNSVKYTNEGGEVCFAAEKAEDADDGRKDKSDTRVGMYRFIVADNGIGISEDFQPKMFEPFTQEHSSESSGTVGTGLGLSIVKRIVDVMNGKIYVDSTKGVGTTITVDLPIEEAEQEGSAAGAVCGQFRSTVKRAGTAESAETADSAETAGSAETTGSAESTGTAGRTGTAKSAGNAEGVGIKESAGIAEGTGITEGSGKLAGKKILVCEDNVLNTEIVGILLRSWGVQVDCAGNGQEGVDAFEKSAVGEYDDILMDLHMPVMDGFEAVHQIRALERPDAKTVPIFAMTADAFEEDVRKCLNSGMNGHVAKPLNPELLYKLLGTVPGDDTDTVKTRGDSSRK